MKDEFAFPLKEPLSNDHLGMTLRDYFAAKALSGSLADPEVNGSFENIAKFAYKMADAMLRERMK